MHTAPACSSILNSQKDSWWCAESHETIATPVIRLELLLNLLPKEYEMFYLKSDTEGSDIQVLAGVGKYLSKFKMVSVEVQNDPNQIPRKNANNEKDTIDFMRKNGFYGSKCSYKECSFTKFNNSNDLDVVILMNKLGHNNDMNCSDYEQNELVDTKLIK